MTLLKYLATLREKCDTAMWSKFNLDRLGNTIKLRGSPLISKEYRFKVATS